MRLVDGDKSLVVADPNFVRIAERNMNGIVPLYYNMQKAEPTELNNKTIYAGLNKAFTSGRIGLYSNSISKIWNNDVFVKGKDEEKQEAINTVKLLCMESNFSIDSAKTLYMPERPDWFRPVVSKYTTCKLPAFFEYAKDKEKGQVQKRNKSFVNKIYDKIPNKKIDTKRLHLPKINYKDMMSNSNVVCSREVSELYNSLNKQYRYMINMKDEYHDNLRYVACKIRGEFSKIGYSDETLTDMLVKYLYMGKGKRYKQLLWFCYGQHIVNNLENNLKKQGSIKKTKFIRCVDCDEWVEVDISSRKIRCDRCSQLERKNHNQKMYENRKFNQVR